MKKIIAIAALLACVGLTACGIKRGSASTEYPQTPKEVAQRFMELYTAGDEAAAEYVLFDGRYIVDLSITPEIARTKYFPKELSKCKQAEVGKIECVSERIVPDEESADPNAQVAYVVCEVDGTPEYLALFQVDGLWKVDITNKWVNEWFDGQIM